MTAITTKAARVGRASRTASDRVLRWRVAPGKDASTDAVPGRAARAVAVSRGRRALRCCVARAVASRCPPSRGRYEAGMPSTAPAVRFVAGGRRGVCVLWLSLVMVVPGRAAAGAPPDPRVAARRGRALDERISAARVDGANAVHKHDLDARGSRGETRLDTVTLAMRGGCRAKSLSARFRGSASA
jgi:hypothetical protein